MDHWQQVSWKQRATTSTDTIAPRPRANSDTTALKHRATTDISVLQPSASRPTNISAAPAQRRDDDGVTLVDRKRATKAVKPKGVTGTGVNGRVKAVYNR